VREGTERQESVKAELRVAIPVPTMLDGDYNGRSWREYAAAVREAGGTPVEVCLRLSERELMVLAQGCDGVLLPGSPSDVDPQLYGQERASACAPADKAREAADRLLLEEAYLAGKPVLGICYGAQHLNVWRGGSLLQDLLPVPVNHAAGSGVAVAHGAMVHAGTILSGLADGEARMQGGEARILINSSHHQAIDRVGDGLRVSSIAAEDGVIEAVEGATGDGLPAYVLGVQWHPERSVALSGTSRAIFGSFVAAMARWKQMRAVPGSR